MDARPDQARRFRPGSGDASEHHQQLLGQRQAHDGPFYRDYVKAWTDAGIFGVFANGNAGPACDTTGSPGDYVGQYGVGAYDSNNTIANFSSRGPGENGQIRPNIAAPGVNVRSTWPGGTYNTISGTSMATPHVSGAVALAWSAAPNLIGDIDQTRTLLDLTARDTENLQCGGTAEDNNVFGEGRLDAQALAQAGPQGVGRLVGTVTDETGKPVAGVPVAAEGTLSRSIRTAADGSYTLPLVAGSYQVTVTGPFGYNDDVQTVEVAADTTLRHDVALTPTPRVALTGVVRDGSGLGTPLPAEVVVAHPSGFEAGSVTDPASGDYTVDVVPNASYTIRVTSEGYQPYEAEVVVGPDGLVHDVALTVSFACTAPGYEVSYDGVRQGFDATNTKWRVTNVDHGYPGYDYRPGWVFTDPGGRTNRTGGGGGFAIVDSDHLGQHHVQDTYLTSPVTDLSGRENAAVEFDTDLVPAINSTATLELSVDGGQTWSTIWRRAKFPGAVGLVPRHCRYRPLKVSPRCRCASTTPASGRDGGPSTTSSSETAPARPWAEADALSWGSTRCRSARRAARPAPSVRESTETAVAGAGYPGRARPSSEISLAPTTICCGSSSNWTRIQLRRSPTGSCRGGVAATPEPGAVPAALRRRARR